MFDHLRARGIDPRSDAEAWFHSRRLITRLERDYHRRKPPIGVRRIVKRTEWSIDLTREELEHLVEMWSDANDPLSRSIASKARVRLGSL